MKNKLPELLFDLPEWTDQSFKAIHHAEKEISKITNKIGKGSLRSLEVKNNFINIIRQGKGNSIHNYINDNVDVRVFTDLLANSSEFYKSIKINSELLNRFLKIREPMSRLSLTQLIRVFIVHFDLVAKADQLKEWSAFIQLQLSRIDIRKGSSVLKTYAKNMQLIFDPYGPSNIVKLAKQKDMDIDVVLKSLAMDGFGKSRFISRCQYEYYLETLKKLKPGEVHSVLTEVCKPDVYDAPHTDERSLGHLILEILIDKSENEVLSQAWQDTILTIAGDPRIPKSHSRYEKWWRILGERRVALMRGWLSKFDLSLFLKILEQSAKDANKSDMERMFKSRKIFMEGLESQGLIVESRLFLSGYAEHYLRRNYSKDQLPNYAHVSSQDTSMIYLRISGNVHMIEGSHSFTLKLIDKLPVRSRVNDYSLKSVSNNAFRTQIGDYYRREYNGSDGLVELRHDQHLNWQYNAIKFLKRKGIKVEIAKMIERSQYRLFKQKFGVF